MSDESEPTPEVLIHSDGTPQGTRVFVNGHDITGSIVSVTWTIGPRGAGKARATIQLRDVGVEVKGELS